MSLINTPGSHLVYASVEIPLSIQMTLFHFSAFLLWSTTLHACGVPSGEKQVNSSRQIKPRHVSMAGSARALLRHLDRSAPGFSPAAESCPMPLTGPVSLQILLAHPATGTTWSVTLSEHICKRLSSLAHCKKYQLLKFLKTAKTPQHQRMLCSVMRLLLQNTPELGGRKRNS